MKFLRPELLNLLWAVLPVAGILTYGVLRRKKIVSAYTSISMMHTIIPGFSGHRRWIKLGLTVVALILAIIAMAGPQWGYRWQKVEQKGVDIMIALDCSKSMLAQDIRPNRLERAKREIIDLLRMMQSDRAGLVAFSGHAILQCPLTMDHQAFHIFLDVLEPGFLPSGGTNLDAAIQSCYSGFESESDTDKAIILITDGEGTTGNTEKTLELMVKHNIKIYCIGVGDLQGAPIPDDDGGFKKDRAGNIILSKVDEKELKKISDITGGAYVRSIAGDMDLELIYKEKIQGTMEKKNLVSGKKKIWENRFQWFLFPSIILFIIEFALSAHKSYKILVLFGLLSFVWFQPHPVQAEPVSKSVQEGIEAFDNKAYAEAMKHFIDAQLDAPDDDRLFYNVGTAAYMSQEYKLAEQNFLKASQSKNIEMRHNALYNLANTRYQLGRYDDAIKGYEDVLSEFPDDLEAKENLEYVKKKQEEQKKQKEKSDSDKKDGETEKKESNKDHSDQNKNDSSQKQHPNKNNPEQGSQKEDTQGKDQQSASANKDEQSQNKNENKPQELGSQDELSRQKNQQQEQAVNRGDPKEMNPKPGDERLGKMLNRLEDKPGRAMMPLGKGNINDKDW